jgi:tryptophan-rich sensory protein
VRRPLSRRDDLLGLGGWFAATVTAATIGGLGSINAAGFYDALDRPPWAPPAWLFGPAWSLLYTLIAIAAWIVWRRRGMAGARDALLAWVLQLLLNLLWTWLFFTWFEGAWAMVGAVALAAAVADTIRRFAAHSRVAAALLIPYLAWVLFASALTWSVWRRNPGLLG